MAGWHHQLDGREFEWTPGDGDGQGGLACCDSWGRKESDTTERLKWNACQLRPGPSLWPEHSGPALGRSSLSPSTGQLGECRPHPLPLQSGRRSLLPILLKAQHSGNTRVSTTIPGLLQPNYRAMTENVQQIMPPNQSRHTLQGSYQKASRLSPGNCEIYSLTEKIRHDPTEEH